MKIPQSNRATTSGAKINAANHWRRALVLLILMKKVESKSKIPKSPMKKRIDNDIRSWSMFGFYLKQ